MLTLADLLTALTGAFAPGSEAFNQASRLYLTEAAIDSRQVIPGALFVALAGERTDGHRYVAEAFKRGASVALVQQAIPEFPVIDLTSPEPPAEWVIPATPFCILVNNTLTALQEAARYWRARLNLRVVGITGSVGKSTTKELVAEVLSQRYRTLKNPGNLNNEIGLPLTVLRLGPGYERAVLEMGFFVPGEIRFLCEIARPQVGVITNVGTVHAERAGSQEAIARGKAELIEALPAGNSATAILNFDDPWVRQMAARTRARVLFYGLDPAAHLWADEIEGLGLEGIRFQLHYGREKYFLRIPLIGRHSVHTALRAAAVGLAEGLTWGEVISGLQRGQSQLRLAAVRTTSGAMLLDDTYNASPESTLAALNLLAEIDGQRVAVLGEMYELGPYEKQGHEMVGARVAEVANRLIAVGPLARMIADAAINAGMPASKVQWLPDVPTTAAVLQEDLKDGDVALVKGSHGLHMEKIIAALETAS